MAEKEDFKLISTSKGFSYGYIVPKESPTTEIFLANLREYNEVQTSMHRKIKLCNQIYQMEGVIATATDALIEFAVSDMTVKGLKGTAKDLINWWLENVNIGADNLQKGIDPFNAQTGIEWFVSGNPFIYKFWSESVNTENGKFTLPMDMLLLNPANIDIPEDSVAFGKKVIIYRPPEEILSIILHGTKGTRMLDPAKKAIFDSIPSDFKQNVTDDGIIMNSEQVSHLKRKGRNYLAWGEPFLVRTFNAIAHKKKLQLLDQATTEGLINMIYLFKIGDPAQPATWAPARVQAFRNLLKNPAASHAIVWAYDAEVETVGPDGDVLNFQNKYQQADLDILRALGIPLGIFTGESKGDQYLATVTLMERLNDFRSELEIFVRKMIDGILERNNIKKQKYRVLWKTSRLRNEKELRDLVVSLRDRGLISVETTLEEAGQDFELEKERKQQEKGKLETLFAPPEMPFSAPKPAKNSPGNSGQKDNNNPPKKTDLTIRDKDQNKNDNNNRKRSVASLKESMKENYKIIIKDISHSIAEEKEVNRIMLHSLKLPAQTEMFIRNLLNSREQLGIKVDSLLEEKFENIKDDFIKSLERVTKKKNFKRLIDTEMDVFVKRVTEAVEDSLISEYEEI